MTDQTEGTALAVEEAAHATPCEETDEAQRLTLLTSLVEQLQQDSARQCEYAKKQLRLTRVFAGCFAVLLAAVLCVGVAIFPRVNSMLQNTYEVLDNALVVATNLQDVSAEIAQTDIAGMLQNIDALVTQSQTGIAQALGDVDEALAVIEAFDIESLNASIQDLQSIISPLARLLGK